MKAKILRRLVFAFACSCLTPIYAASWHIFNTVWTDHSYYFFDLETVIKQGGSVTLWIKFADEKPNPNHGGLYSAALREVFTCLKHTNQILAVTSYGIYDGEKFTTSNSTPGQVTDIVPGSVDDQVFAVVCAPDFPNNKPRGFYHQPAKYNDIFIHAEELFSAKRAAKADPMPQ